MLETPTSPVINDMARQRKILIVAAIAIGILLVTTIIAVITTIVVLRNQRASLPVTPPMETATPAAVPIPPLSKFATDAGVLQLKSAVSSLSVKIDSIDLFETEITPPNLDLHLSIAPQP